MFKEDLDKEWEWLEIKNVVQEDEDFNLPEVREFIGPGLHKGTIIW